MKSVCSWCGRVIWDSEEPSFELMAADPDHPNNADIRKWLDHAGAALDKNLVTHGICPDCCREQFDFDCNLILGLSD